MAVFLTECCVDFQLHVDWIECTFRRIGGGSFCVLFVTRQEDALASNLCCREWHRLCDVGLFCPALGRRCPGKFTIRKRAHIFALARAQ